MELEQKIAVQREKLLSLSLQNPLLSMSLSARSATLIRVIHELPDELFRRIVRGESDMRFEGLPDIDQGLPSDEMADQFEKELARAKLTDEEYLEAVSMPAPTDEAEAEEAFQRIEFALRDRVRERLGMPPVNREHQETEIETALRLGLNHSFDLPRPELGEHRAEYGDNKIQTLLRQKALERRERTLYRDVMTKEQDLGYSSLFATFGCLEWVDQRTAARKRLAPLLLAPLDQEMRVVHGAKRLYVRASDREPTAINICLIERLRRENLILPEFEMADSEPIDTPETYFEKIEEWLRRNRPEWRLRRFVNVSSVQFSRLAMYKDLDPSLWNRRPPDSGLLATLLDGPIADADKVEETPAETREIEGGFDQPLIRDADASQLAAIAAALRGESFGLQGPPGAGKSQTIANLIAAALAKGERVLFMAEKIAALNVVYDRLKDAGLGPFCLELHSNKARKSDFVAALKARLDMDGVRPPRNMDAALVDLKTLRARLNDYADLIGKPFGAREEPLHDVIWFATLSRRRLDALAPSGVPIASLRFAPADKATEADLETGRRALASYVAQIEAVRRAVDDVGVHPYAGLAIEDPSRFSQERVFGALLPATAALKSIVETFGELFDLETASIEKLVALADEVRGAPMTIDPLALAALEVLRSPDRVRLEGFLAAVESFQRKDEPQALASDEGPLLIDERLATLAAATARAELPAGSRLSDLGAFLGETRARRDRLEDMRRAGTDLLACMGLEQSATFGDVIACLDALDLMERAPTWSPRFHSAILPDSVFADLEICCREALRLREERARLSEVFAHERLPADPAELIAHAEALETAGLFSFFSSDVRAAQRVVREAAAGGGPLEKGQAAAELRASVRFMAEAEALRTNPLMHSLFDDEVGIDAPFEEVIAIEGFKRDAASRFGGVSRVDRLLFGRVLSNPVERSGAAFLTPSQREAMRAFFADAPPTFQLAQLGRQVDMLSGKTSELEKLVERLEAIGLDPLAPLAELARLRAVRAAYLVERDHLDQTEPFGDALAPFITGADTDFHGLRVLLREARAIDAFPVRKEKRSSFETVAGYEAALSKLSGLDDALKAFGSELATFAGAAGVDPEPFIGFATLDAASPRALLERLERVAAAPEVFASWAQRCAARGEAVALEGVSPIVAYLEAVERVTPVDEAFAEAAFDYAYRIQLLDAAYAAYPNLPRLRAEDLSSAQHDFRSADRAVRELDRRRAIAATQRRAPPEGSARGTVGSLTEMRLIRHLAEQSRPRQSIRSVLERADSALAAIMPCVLMSPSSVAQFLPRTTDIFDLLIIDEASQMRPEDALGALMRCKRAVIVGDPEQMPPSTLFEPRNVAGEPVEEEDEDDFGDVESILVLANGRLPNRRELRWHYRSRHESLIAFSNAHVYQGSLEVFPSPIRDASKLGVSYEAVESGYNASLNVPEAEAVIRHAARHAQEHAEDSLGLVALNKAQSDLLFEMVEQLRGEDPGFNDFCARHEDSLEPVFVKNLENVQGDERDAIVISTVYGRNRTGARASRFPLLNRATGYRRLNVLITRAKKRVTVVTSLKPGEITENALKNRGVKMLADYIEYARTGELPLDVDLTGGKPESPFEQAVAAALRARGYEVEPQVGAVGYRVDIGVRDPTNPDRFILGVECDGARYHATPSARERDRLRQEVLESLGWHLHRIWSTNWFENEAVELEKLIGILDRRQV